MQYFSNKIIWITGASSGIGEHLAYELAQKGCKLILSARRIEELERVKNRCHSSSQIQLLPLDLASGDELVQISRKALEIYGDMDIIFHNGGISQRDFAKNTKTDVDRRIMEVNYFGTMTITKALLPYFLEKKKGHFVVITSVLGKVGTPKRSAYAASKHALHGFFDALRAECHHDNVKVTLICPGYIHTQLSLMALMGDGSAQNKMDEGQKSGMNPALFAQKALAAVSRQKNEVYIGGFREVMAIYLKRFVPSLFARIVANTKVT